MKKIKNILLTFGAVAGLVACNDAIDIQQPGRLDAEAAFQSVDDLQAGLFGVYDNYDISTDIAFQSIFTDELSIGFDNGGQGLADYGFVLNAGSAASQVFWTNGYDQLNAANRLIEAAENLDPEEIAEDPELYDQVLGEAYALRAWGHFILLSYYSTDYADDSALSVINLDFVPTIDQQLLRNTNGETFELIQADLNRANGLLSDDTANKTRINKDFVTALRARIAAYRENYALAATLSQQLIDKYPLANRAEYEAMFLDESDGEVIFKLERTANDNFDGQGTTGSAFAGGWAGARFAFVDATLSGSPYFEMGRSLFNIIDPNDVRYDVIVAPSSLIDPDYEVNQNPATDILVIQKYPGSEGQPLMNDLKIFRSSEMYLIRAEAAVAQGNLGVAAGLIKDIRDARFGEDTTAPSFGSQTEAYAAILDERRVELAYEGHRYLDLKRLGARANQGVLKDPIDCAFNGACTLSADDFRFTLPLPIIEFNGNPGLREQQNPGY
ncbi:RagB/SusD family nutrient uptake outer membrane protein [Robiginitalea aurantiaca]|uniref:RagB/SusD family nutrient uptake outer membrane protein n=1 Tax=Robiginitalea aurantiaca TaxID=3056915 RepID=A0ABT7WFJ9_9FLAO|nr:RagB/SusD family nutrient uptake outer membrane protein [Robiginitalea aurantiaca]MDM9631599.1 RagB/SusD family nutrient uptake outer membrane protein [Robiginitalea aurantiaca]